MQQNGQTDRTSIVSRLQAVVGKDRLLLSIKQCLPEAANHQQVRTGLVSTATGARSRSTPILHSLRRPVVERCLLWCMLSQLVQAL